MKRRGGMRGDKKRDFDERKRYYILKKGIKNKK